MSRNYSVRPHKNFVYSVDELIDLYEVNKNTVSNWISEGLRPSDSGIPYVFNGSEIKRFHDSRSLATHAILRIGQFKCLGCKGRVFPVPASLNLLSGNRPGIGLSASCPDCDRVVFKRVSPGDYEQIKVCINTNTNTNTSLASLDEDIEPAPVGFGKDQHTWCTVNDRIIYAWLQYAGRYDRKTIIAHLASIREFERICGGKDFHKLTVSNVTTYRDQLKAMAKDGQLSVSTIRHRVSRVKSLINWLIDQKGYSALEKTLAGYLDLPKMFGAKSLEAESKPVPSMEEAVRMVQEMPSTTRKGRRDRAMICTAFLGALRADTVTSLHICHAQMEAKHLVQDGRRSRTKNGKSLRIWFFPIPDIFADTLNEWKQELLALGYLEKDALFPDNTVLSLPRRSIDSKPIEVMKSTNAIALAFKIASSLIGKEFSPHSAKHCIGQLSWSVCRTAEERKAWSGNMGHDNEDVTQRYYSKISKNRMAEIFAGFDDQVFESDEDKELMLRYHEHGLTKGTAEFSQAKKLVAARRLRMVENDDDAVIE